MRKPIFDVIRVQRGKGFTAEEVQAVDGLLNRLGVEEDDAAELLDICIAEPVPIASTDADTAGFNGFLNFFDSVRGSGLFERALTPDQMNGIKAVCGAAQAAGWPLAFTAYALATAHHETAYTMLPVREAFWLSESWRSTNLRYYPFYGRGYVQLTWKENYEQADRKLGLGRRLIGNPDLALDPDIAAKIMVNGMHEGWFCAERSGQRHTLARHLPADGRASVAEFTAARRIINGTDKAGKIAREAVKFQAALLCYSAWQG